MFFEWVLGILFRPAATFEWAQRNVRMGYWWIVLSDITLNVVMSIYSPPLPGQPPASASDQAWLMIMLMLVLFDLQALILLGVSRLFRWSVSWPQALKLIGMAWSILLVQDIVLFYPSLKGLNLITFWGSVPFLFWFIIALAGGIKRVSGLSAVKSVLLVALASLPWEAALLWNNWVAFRP